MYIDRIIATVWCLSNVKRRFIVLLSPFDWCSTEGGDFERTFNGNPFELVNVPDKDFVSIELDVRDVNP